MGPYNGPVVSVGKALASIKYQDDRVCPWTLIQICVILMLQEGEILWIDINAEDYSAQEP